MLALSAMQDLNAPKIRVASRQPQGGMREEAVLPSRQRRAIGELSQLRTGPGCLVPAHMHVPAFVRRKQRGLAVLYQPWGAKPGAVTICGRRATLAAQAARRTPNSS